MDTAPAAASAAASAASSADLSSRLTSIVDKQDAQITSIQDIKGSVAKLVDAFASQGELIKIEDKIEDKIGRQPAPFPKRKLNFLAMAHYSLFQTSSDSGLARRLAEHPGVAQRNHVAVATAPVSRDPMTVSLCLPDLGSFCDAVVTAAGAICHVISVV